MGASLNENYCTEIASIKINYSTNTKRCITLSLYDRLKQSIDCRDICWFVPHFRRKQMEFSVTLDNTAIRQQETEVR